MLNLRKIAITGGIASGKSSVCRLFQELGAFVVSADAIVHELLAPGTDICKQVSGLLDVLEGPEFRKAVAKTVFKDPKLLEQLEKILHPLVLKKIEELYVKTLKTGNYRLFVVEMPLVFEIQHETFYDTIIAVIADDALAKKRFEISGFSDYENRMERQLSPEKKASLSDFVIENNGSIEALRKQVNQISQEL